MTLLRQDFEDVPPGSYPDNWHADGSSEQRVVSSESFDGTRSLEMVGSHGGCWEAIANVALGALPTGEPVRIAGAVKPAGAGSFGCHDRYGTLRLRTDVGSWSAGDSRRLLKFGADRVISGSGLSLGEFTPGAWVSYEITYSYLPDRGEVRVNYGIDGEPRGSTTVSPTDTEDDLSYLAFNTGDFTAYWDSLTVETSTERVTPDQTQTPSPTERPPPTETQPRSTPTPTSERPVTTPTSAPYDLRAAQRQTEVRPFGRTLLVLRGIPGAAGRAAVATTDYQLVGTDTARDAFVTYVQGRSETGFDWEAELSYARTMRGKHGASELWNRAAGLGWDALAAYAMAQVNPAAAVGPVLEALQDSAAWATHEISDPYMEAMSKQTQWTYTHREIERDIERADSLVEMTDFMFDFVQTADQINGLAGTWDDALAAARTAYSTSGSFSTSLAAGGAAVSGAVYYAAVGELVTRGVDTVTAGMEQNAKLSAIGHAYSTTRIPVIRRILELESRRQDNALSPCGAWELAYLTMNHHYMGAFANHGMYKHAHAIEESAMGGVWDTLVNLTEVASVLEDRAASYQWGGAAAHRDFGVRMGRVRTLTADSLNRELHGSPTPLGGGA